MVGHFNKPWSDLLQDRNNVTFEFRDEVIQCLKYWKEEFLVRNEIN